MECKFNSYTELAEAFNSGKLKRNEWTLVLDNDCCHLKWRGSYPEGVDSEEFDEQKYEEGQKLFRGGGYGDLEDACKAAGIPCEWC